MRTLDIGFKAHIESGATTLATCWKIARRDEMVLGFTDHDETLSFGGTDYVPAHGLDRGEASAKLGPSVDTAEVLGILHSDAITEDGDGVDHEVSLDGIDAGRAELLLPAGIDAPALREHHGIEIDYVAGYGETADDVPAPLKQALQLVVAYWFEHRDTVFGIGEGPAVPMGFDSLVAPYRVVRL